MKGSWKARMASLLICLLMVLSLFSAVGMAENASVAIGDINNDAEISAADALLILQHSVKLITLHEDQCRIADVDGNDKVDPTDALYILQYVVELIERFPADEMDPDPDPDPDPDSDPDPDPTPDPGYGLDPNPGPEMEVDLEHMIRVTDAPYHAKGDGKTNDRAAIQAAIDAAHQAGGGTVGLTAGKTFYTGNLIMKSNVVLYFEEGAMLKQSGNPQDYVKPVGEAYEEYRPSYGCMSSDILWGHAWLENYPFLYAGEGTENITITAASVGLIEMTRGPNGCADTIHIEPIGFYKTKNYEVSNLKIQKFSAYLFHSFCCNNGLIKNIVGREPSCGSNDGIGLLNCQDIRVTGCDLITSDDGCYVLPTYGDPRGGVWYDPNAVQPSKNIEIDHNRFELTWDACKAFCLFAWGAACPDQRLVEVSNIYVHDNWFESMGIWNDFPFDETADPSPIKNVRFENNTIGTIQENFFSTPISDLYGYDCMPNVRNGDFEKTGDAYWVSRKNAHADSAGAKDDTVGQDGNYYGYIDHLDQGDAALYQGIKLTAGRAYTLVAKVQSSGAPCRVFVRDQITQEPVILKEFSNTIWEEQNVEFEVPKDGNYHIGIERGKATEGWARIDSVSLRSDIMSDVLADNTIFTSQTPQARGEEAAELGTVFSAKYNGLITKARIYTDAQESGIHTVRLWDCESKAVLAGPYEWDIEAGTAGWREFVLPQPAAVKAGKKYMIAVSTSSGGGYAKADNQLGEPIAHMDLITYENSGVYTDTIGAMPSAASASNYFRDVVYEPDRYTLFTTQVPNSTADNFGGCRNILGTLFSPKVDGTVTKARLYTSALEEGIHFVSLWDADTGALVSADTYEWETLAGVEGWQEYTLSEPVAVKAGKKYVISISAGPNGYGVRTTPNGVFPVNHGCFLTYEESGRWADMNVSPDEMPAGKAAECYFRDVVFVPDASFPEAVTGMIDALPSPVAMENKEAVASARLAYDTLNDTQKKMVNNLDRLIAAEARLDELEEDQTAAEDQAKADEAIALIDALPSAEEAIADHAPAIREARQVFDALTEAQKGLVGADRVEKLQALIERLADFTPGVTIYTDQIPAQSHDGGGLRNQYGTIFTAKVSGTVSQVRIYTDAKENGIHYVSLWDYATSTMISAEMYEWDIASGTTGWQTFSLPETVHLDAGKQYVVSVSAGPDCLYTITTNVTQNIENDYLKVQAASAGCYTADAINGFEEMPSVVSAFYLFRDVVFVPDEPLNEPSSSGYSLFTDQVPNSTADNFGGCRLYLGTLFSPKVDGTVTKVRLYTSALEEGIHYVNLWDAETGALVSADTYEWEITAGFEGWQEFTLPEPVALKAGKQYVVSVSAGPNGYGVRTTPSGVFPVTNDTLVTYETSGRWADMAVYPDAMPAGEAAECYFRDVVFVPSK